MKQLLYFTSKLCAPCKALYPIMEELSLNYNVTKVDVQEQPDVAKRYGVQFVPTTILLESGREIERKIGVQSKNYYIQILK